MKRSVLPSEVANQLLAQHRLRLAARMLELAGTVLIELKARGPWGPAQQAEWEVAVTEALDDALADFRRAAAAAAVPASAAELDS